MGSQPVPFIDGHNDVLLRLQLAGDGAAPFLAGRSEGHLDLERARRGGFASGFFAVFVLPETEEERAATQVPAPKPPYAHPLAGSIPTEYALREAGPIVDLLDELTAGGEVCLARATIDVQAALAGGPLAAILHFEGAEPIEPDLGNLAGLYERGLRSIGLVWSRPNAFATGVPFRFPSTPDIGDGLTAAGRLLVAACSASPKRYATAATTKRTWPSWRTPTGSAFSVRPGPTKRKTLFTTAGCRPFSRV